MGFSPCSFRAPLTISSRSMLEKVSELELKLWITSFIIFSCTWLTRRAVPPAFEPGFLFSGLWPFPRNYHPHLTQRRHNLIALQEWVCPKVAVIDSQCIRQPITAAFECRNHVVVITPAAIRRAEVQEHMNFTASGYQIAQGLQIPLALVDGIACFDLAGVAVHLCGPSLLCPVPPAVRA